MDMNEETLTGSCTMHLTNGIAVQRPVACCGPPPRASSDVTTAKRRRSLPAPAYEVPDYNASVRRGPAAIAAPEGALANTGSPGNDHRVLLWGMSRLSSKDDSLLGRPDTTVHCVPSWSGFCAKLQYQQENSLLCPLLAGYSCLSNRNVDLVRANAEDCGHGSAAESA